MRDDVKPAKSKALCSGCTDDFYNGQGAAECWLYKDAKVVKRFRIGWWTMQDKAENFTPVYTFQCHHARGQYALMEQLPEHLRAQRLAKEAGA